MEIQTIVLENWMCRICLAKGTYDIFNHHLLPPPFQQQQTTKVETTQGHHHSQQSHLSAHCDGASNSVSIVDALNHFSEFKISPSEIANEPTMLCENCCAELHQCYQFRIKLNEAECLLRRDTLSQEIDINDDGEEQESKTGLTLHLRDIEPFLEDIEDIKTEGLETISTSSTAPEPLPKLQPKIHHAKPRFQLTNKVSSILRHVTSSTSSTVSGEKRKGLEGLAESTTRKKMQRRNSNADKQLDKTLIVPNYIFANEIDEHAQVKTVLLVEKSVVASPSKQHIPSESEVDRTEDGEIFYCKHCPKAFSTPYHLLTHTKATHLCQHCLKYLPNAQTRNRHIREEHKTFRCSLCSNFQSPYVANLRAHLRKTHSVVLPAHVSILQQPETTGNK